MNTETNINTGLVDRIKKLSTKKSELETEKNLLTNQLTELDNKIKAAGFDPDNLAAKVEELRGEINAFEEKAKTIVDKIEADIKEVENCIFNSFK